MLDKKKIIKTIQEVMAESNVPGAAVSIFTDKEILFEKGFGTLALGSEKPVVPETPFQIASLTKPLTAALIMILVENGFLKLDNPIIDYVPEIRFSIPDAEKSITLRMLLNHSAGLQNGGAFEGDTTNDGLGNYIKNQIPEVKFVTEPGIISSYSNHNFNIAGYVAETVIKKPFKELMKAYVFDQIDMKNSFFGVNESQKEVMAMNHSKNTDSVMSTDPEFVYNSECDPSFMVNSNIMDYSKFLMMLLNHGMIGKKQILMPESVDEMFRISKRDLVTAHSGTGISFGVEQYEKFKKIMHSGGVKSTLTWIEIYPEKLVGMAVFSNFPMDREKILNEIRSELNVTAPKKELKSIPADESLFSKFEGTYLGDFVGIVKIEKSGSDLIAVKNGVAHKLHSFEKSIYFATDDTGNELFSVGFVENNKEKTEYITVNFSPCKRTERTDLVFGKKVENLEEFTGTYNYGSAQGSIHLVNGKLQYTDPEGEKIDLIPITETLFTSNIGLMTFKKENGNIIFSIQNSWDCVKER
ncbi:MAG TPA: serine hydrolase domain-containing protein [bacterium]|nr:serine hydrolase domain-containing protein [bacterium]